MKLITKFISFVITLSVLMSVLVLPVSATEEETEKLLTNFSGVTLEAKAKLYSDEGLKYKYCFIYRNSDGRYIVNFIHDTTSADNTDDISYLSFYNASYTKFFTSDDVDTMQCRIYLVFDANGNFLSCSGVNCNASVNGWRDFYNFSSATDKVQNAVDNIVYSDFDVKYNGLTVYQTENNKAVSIADIVELKAGDGTGEIAGPQKLPTEHQLYGTYVEKNEETWSAFIDWLIANEYYTELAQYGLTATVDNIGSLANTWWDNKFSPTLFWDLMKTNGINTLSSAKSVISWFNTKWQTYINHNYVSVPVGQESHSSPHHRAELMTDKTDEEGNIIDSDEVSLLREIVRQLENLPLRVATSIYGVIYPIISNIADNTYAVLLALADMPSHIANAVYNNFVDPINLILDALHNQTSDNDIDINHDVDYKTTFQDVQDTLNNKFAFYHQLTEVKTILQTSEFSEEKPFLMLAGQQLDFALFDDNREIIHKIIVTIAYLNFFLNLLRSLPVYIGGI